MKRLSKFFLGSLAFFILKSDVVIAQINTAGSYVWNATDAPKVFNGKFQLSFESSQQGFPNYGTVLAGGGYYNGQDGAAFQMYFPYNSYYGGIAPQVRFGSYDNGGWSSWSTFFTTANANLSTIDWNTKNLTVYGNVLIGKTSQTNSSYKLDINGDARANKVVVNTTGADFVFDSAYQLPKVDSLSAFIEKYHHLPDIQSAQEMQKQGLDVGANQMKLLQKIEELTLYIIDLKKQLELKNEEIQQLEKINLRVTAIEKKLKK